MVASSVPLLLLVQLLLLAVPAPASAGTVHKSANDQRLYETTELANGLRASVGRGLVLGQRSLH